MPTLESQTGSTDEAHTNTTKHHIIHQNHYTNRHNNNPTKPRNNIKSGKKLILKTVNNRQTPRQTGHHKALYKLATCHTQKHTTTLAKQNNK